MRRLLILLIVVSACSSKQSKILPFEKMEVVLWDIIQINAYANTILIKDTSIDLRTKMAGLEKTVFEKHKVDSKVFFETYDYYMSDPKLYVELMDSIMVHNKLKPEDYLPPVKERRNDLKIDQNE